MTISKNSMAVIIFPLLILPLTTSCGSGPDIIDRPDYSSFVDFLTGNDDGKADNEPRDTPEDTGQDLTTDAPGDKITMDVGDAGDSHDNEPDIEDVTADGLDDNGTGNDIDCTDMDARDDVEDSHRGDTEEETSILDAFDDAPSDNGTDFGDIGYEGQYEGMDDLTGTPLVQALCPLVRQGTTTVSYDAAKDYLRDDVDNHDGQILEIYTGQWWDPDAGIINVEHTWPQSKGAGSAPMQGDMHHLFLSHSYYNSARSNYPFGMVSEITYDGNSVPPFPDEECTDRFPDSDWTGCMTYVGRDSTGSMVCEPRDAQKGNTARAIFYFQLRYGGSGCSLKPLSTFDTYGSNHDQITETTLKDWNRRDPPDVRERTRNSRIEAYEGVRNPFIDHPEFVDRIDFTP